MKKYWRKRAGIILLTGGMTFMSTFPALAQNWIQDENGWWYGSSGPAGSSGSYPVSSWERINDQWYYFDDKGYMETGWVETDGKRYYLDPGSGAMLHDTETTIDGLKYQFNSSGETSQLWPYKLPAVIPPENEKSETHKSLDQMCDNVLAGIINDSMGEREKVTAIYSWVRSNFRYSGHSSTRDWVEEAYQGIRRHHGDCYTYFAVSQALLTRAGFPSIEVVRYTDNDHFWNLTQVDGSWYHFDTTPRSYGGTFCLLTDAQMNEFSVSHYNCFAFDPNLYPPTP